ncbi:MULTISPECIES: hypothetical protein [Microbacterium]|nr:MULTISPECIES: hypothetical protein [Microbacterium]
MTPVPPMAAVAAVARMAAMWGMPVVLRVTCVRVVSGMRVVACM